MSRLFSVFFLLVFAVLTEATPKLPPLEYGLMLDGGSTGTRIHIYEWPERTRDTIPIVEQAPIGQAAWTLSTEPGIASFLNNLEGIPEYLEPLISYAYLKLDPSKYSSTPIYMFCTAGMRLLTVPQQNTILQVVRQVLSNTSFQFQNENARVIPGYREGIFGWITVNYLLHRLHTNKTVGALDLGGASTQITYVPENIHKNPFGYSQHNISIGEKNFTLYAHSFLGYGSDEARYSVNRTLAEEAPYPPSVEDGCLLNETVVPFSFNDTNYILHGTSNFSSCVDVIDTLFDKNDCKFSNCSFNGIYEPSFAEMDFLAFSGFYYFTSFFNESGEISLMKVGELASSYCGLTLEEALEEYHEDPGDLLYIQNNCFAGTYAYQLLAYGYGFPVDKVINFEGSLNGVDLDWTLGAMIYEADLLPINL